jgi:hypothetical protein
MNSESCKANLSARATRFHPFASLVGIGRAVGMQRFLGASFADCDALILNCFSNSNL